MLKALELAGFKSFADKTRFDFHDGVTVVVGPNGSGKSNVVDAIKWVLGSQSAKSLRGSEMTDVIFNGSGSRTALNAAEVTLLLDNSSGAYGGDTLGREVAISRRVYRSGEAEYLINGSACRLRDVRDLLAGTGIGTEAYSIIEQGKVDALLQASPRDRRAIFEEAAGISRFRAKRQDAARRLARVEQNLLRLSDIVDEVESRLRSVRMQAGKAQRYREGVKRLKELRTQIGIADWFRLTERIDNVAGELNTFTDEHTSQREWMEQTEQQLPELEQQLHKSQTECEAVDQQLGTLREKIARHQASIGGLAARQEDLQANIHSLEQQWRAASARPTEADASKRESLSAKLEAARGEYDQLARLLADSSEKLHVTATRAERLTIQFQELSERLAGVENRLQLAEQKLSAGDDRATTVDKQLAEATEELRQLAAQHETHLAAIQRLASDRQASQQQAEAATDRLQSGQQALAGDEQKLAEVRRACQQAQTDLATGKHRIELMLELDREQATASQQVRQFVEQTLGGKPLSVADVLHVDADTAPIIEAALGGLAEYLVAPSSSLLLERAGDLPPHARLMRLDWRTPVAAIDQVDLSAEAGVWGRADQFVDSEAAYQPLVRRLLGRTWIVDTLLTANRLAHSLGHGLHFVTADGDVLSADGALVIGGRQTARASFTRRQSIEQLQQQVGELAPRAASLAEQQADLERSIQEQREQVAREHDANRQALEAAAGVREQLAAANSHAQVAQQRTDEVRRRVNTLRDEAERHETELGSTRRTIESLETQRQQLVNTCGELGEQSQQAGTVRDEVSQRVKQLELDVAKRQHQIEALETALSAHPASSGTSDLREQLSRQRDALVDRREQVERDLLAANASLAELTSQLEEVAPRKTSEAKHQQELREQHASLLKRLQAARRHIDESQARRSQLELTLAKLHHQRQSLADRMHEDYQIDLPDVAASAPAERPALDRKQVEREIEQLREGLHKIGAVNVDALEELDEIESRFEAISSQYNDLSQAKASLERLMAKLNSESRQMFLSTVETVRGHFQELFRRLFGGGEADILLEEYESEDALDCGVEIRASPPGKEMSTISLLSGGEKTMTCVALLLAMFRSKPSPFCVLDEVDAALDEANIGRFTGVLSDFLSSTQFIVITHSKKTMTGANTLYGVTMQESGVSKQVSVRFDDVTEDGFIKPRAMRNDPPPQARAA